MRGQGKDPETWEGAGLLFGGASEGGLSGVEAEPGGRCAWRGTGEEGSTVSGLQSEARGSTRKRYDLQDPASVSVWWRDGLQDLYRRQWARPAGQADRAARLEQGRARRERERAQWSEVMSWRYASALPEPGWVAVAHQSPSARLDPTGP